MIDPDFNEIEKRVRIDDAISKCMGIIESSNKLLISLHQMGKKRKIKKAAGKMILQERENIKKQKTKLLLLGTSYEHEKNRIAQQYATKSTRSTYGMYHKQYAGNTRFFIPDVIGSIQFDTRKKDTN